MSDPVWARLGRVELDDEDSEYAEREMLGVLG